MKVRFVPLNHRPCEVKLCHVELFVEGVTICFWNNVDVPNGRIDVIKCHIVNLLTEADNHDSQCINRLDFRSEYFLIWVSRLFLSIFNPTFRKTNSNQYLNIGGVMFIIDNLSFDNILPKLFFCNLLLVYLYRICGIVVGDGGKGTIDD